MDYLAHTREDQSAQTLLAHLQGTAERAGQFAQRFQAEETAKWAGLLHDLGKYSEEFQKRIRGGSKQVDHSTAGGQWLAENKHLDAHPLIFSVLGHHSGLPDLGTKYDPQGAPSYHTRLKKDIPAYDAYQTELTLPSAIPQHPYESDPRDKFFYTKMLYSCLVDADFLDTEAFMQGEVERSLGKLTAWHKETLENYIAPWFSPKNELNALRSEILRAVMANAQQEKNMFSLTVPTGGGKTISSLAFALEHALYHEQDRIIYVIPYTSIIEQTQDIFEKIFGEGKVLAHYANVAYQRDEQGNVQDKRYLASENWDAPIILTTAVQFFESLFSNRSSHCRKLHNIINSTIIFDEAQMLPLDFLRPCLVSIAQLVKHYGCSAVLCTATQPALDKLLAEAECLAPWHIAELCPRHLQETPLFQRVRFEQVGKLEDAVLSQRLQAEKQVLCIVNTRAHAQTLYQLLQDENTYHLSTTLCPKHRRVVLEEIRKNLKEGLDCRVIATSLVEAGVDLDFPTVYRAMAGLDSILQAGGRCNREGTRPAEESKVYVFKNKQHQPASLCQNIDATEMTLDMSDDLESAKSIHMYFDALFHTVKGSAYLDKEQILEQMKVQAHQSIANEFHLIEDKGMTLYIPYDAEGDKLIKQYKTEGVSRKLLRQLGQYAVSLPEWSWKALRDAGSLQMLADNTAYLTDPAAYEPNLGILL